MALEKIKVSNTTYDIKPITTINEARQPREITEYSWGEIKNLIKNNDFKDIKVGDFKKITIKNSKGESKTLTMRVAGVNTYTGIIYTVGDSTVTIKKHIDWCSDEILEKKAFFSREHNNSTTSTSAPYRQSNIFKLSQSLYNTLPSDLKNNIAKKYCSLTKRYNSSGTVEKDTGIATADLDYLWLPTEYEIFGEVITGTKYFSAGAAVQYPLYEKYPQYRCKGSWLRDAANNSTKNMCCINEYGSLGERACNTEYGFPVCFRIEED